MKSFSSFSNNLYTIPKSQTDKKLYPFCKENKQKVIVAVQGLGFVGTAMSLVIANAPKKQFAVLGVDLKSKNSYWKIEDINNGVLPISSSDKLLEKYFNNALKEKNFLATYDVKSYSMADIIIIDINLDVEKMHDKKGIIKSYDVPLNTFKKAIKTIGENCKENALIIIESTVPPGTTRKVIEPIISRELKKRGLSSSKFFLAHSYERVMPGPNYINSIKNFYRVFSGINDASAKKAEVFFKKIISTKKYPLTRLQTPESSEMAKVLENSFRAMNISFIDEWSRFAEKSGVNLFEVVDAIRMRPTHKNLMYPGIGVGGYCLPKDPLIASWSSENFFNLEGGLKNTVNAVNINDNMPRNCFLFVENILKKLRFSKKNIALLGVSYSPDIGDTRNSPVSNFYENIKKISKKVGCFDPYLNFWDEKKIKIHQNIDIIFKNNDYEILIFTTAHKHFVDNDRFYKLLRNSKSDPIIIDAVGLIDPSKLPPRYQINKNFFSLGVG